MVPPKPKFSPSYAAKCPGLASLMSCSPSHHLLLYSLPSSRMGIQTRTCACEAGTLPVSCIPKPPFSSLISGTSQSIHNQLMFTRPPQDVPYFSNKASEMQRGWVYRPNLQLITGIHIKPMTPKATLLINPMLYWATPAGMGAPSSPYSDGCLRSGHLSLWASHLAVQHLGDGRHIEGHPAQLPFPASQKGHLGIQKLASSGYPDF